MLTGRRTFEVADGWGGQYPWDIPAFVATHQVPDGWPRPARQSSSSPTASKTPLLKRNRLPTRSAWECRAPKRSSGAWPPACSMRSIDLAAVLLGAGVRLFDHLANTGRPRESTVSPAWVSRICAIRARRRPSAVQRSFRNAGPGEDLPSKQRADARCDRVQLHRLSGVSWISSAADLSGECAPLANRSGSALIFSAPRSPGVTGPRRIPLKKDGKRGVSMNLHQPMPFVS